MTDDSRSADGHAPELRASDADRERVAERLREAVAEGRLDMEEFDERLEAAYKARTYGELAPLTRDLPAAGVSAPVSFDKAPAAAEGGAGAVDWAARIGGEATSTGAFACCGGFSRKGRWTVGERFTVYALCGGGEIDLREARFASREVEIRCYTLMGGVEVKVPPELDVTVHGFGLMGGVDDRAGGPGTPGSPRVVIKGYALMGGVGVTRKPPKDERRRLKDERRRELEADRRERHEARRERREERRRRRY
ncbi:DUF1707 SHOCT-like domain-containing protein [Streptomyces beihaiensis]|uniref:DUF1707 domain-containing protein n=1 Tax=Streptomyces beihaiensis TaxID=2984495 RepID=A0ABT3TTK6_9ACTN|nr:DUF1707 domain-containing protein [Streptomyces beihaiensis]MCX3060120.1 DUF1707 domain-containing protein [Streptomyces beihaiensis]